MLRFKKVLRQAVLLAGGLIAAELEYVGGYSSPTIPPVGKDDDWRRQNDIPANGAILVTNRFWGFLFPHLTPRLEKVGDILCLSSLDELRRKKDLLILRRIDGKWYPHLVIRARRLGSSRWRGIAGWFKRNEFIVVTIPEGHNRFTLEEVLGGLAAYKALPTWLAR